MESFHSIWHLQSYSPDTAGESVQPRCDICSKRGCTSRNHSSLEREVSAECKAKIGNKSRAGREIWDAHWEEVFNNPTGVTSE